MFTWVTMARHVFPPVVHPRPEEQALLQSIVENPSDDALWLILADWLEEYDDPRRAELLRLHRQLIATCCEPEQYPQREAWQTRLVQLLAEGVRPSVPQQTLRLGEGVPMTFAWIGPGRFLMGSPESEDGRRDNEAQHTVTLSRGFWLAVTPVTQSQWQAVMDGPLAQVKRVFQYSYFKGKDLPVETVTWDDCQAFCRQLGERAGQSLRLPTEAEWEYACRAGTSTPFFVGEVLSVEQANVERSVYRTTAVGTVDTTAVGSFPPNAWDLYDMHGNVWEWCQDWYAPSGQEEVQDPAGPATGTARVLRGGCWGYRSWDCRAAYRNWDAPAYRDDIVGFRVAIRLD
jgi:uncharacterized protein (TIGR02996 family)